VVADADGRISFANSAAEATLGLTRDKITGRTYNDPEWKICDLSGGPFPPECLPFSRVMKTQAPIYDIEHGIETTDGRRILLSINSAPVKDRMGEVTGMVSSITDITERVKAKGELIWERDKAEMYLEIAGVILIALDKNGRVEMINRKGCEVLGASKEEIVGKNWFDTFLPREIQNEVKEVHHHNLVHGIEPGIYHENPILRADGDERTIAWYNSALRDSNGKLVGTLSSGEDITDRVRAEQLLRESEEKYRTLSFNVPGMIYQADVKWSVPIMLNSEIVCGFTSDDFLANNVDWLDLIHPDDKHKATEEGSQLTEKEMSILQEYRVFDKEGKTRWVADRKTSVFNDDGSFKGIYGVVYDITDSKLTEERSGFLAEMLTSSPLSVIAVDRTIKITYINPATETLFGYETEELLQQNPSMLIANLDSVDVRRDILDTILKKGIWRGEILAKKKSRGVFTVRASIYGLQDAKGVLSSFVGFQEDITERKKMENELIQRRSELRQLSVRLRRSREVERATIARELHDEFGQALTAMKININILETECKNYNVTREVLERLGETGVLADQLLDQVRDLALELRPSMLDDLGLSAALKWYVRGFNSRTSIECDLHIGGQHVNVSENRRTVAYRAVQEALTNVARHAQAKSVGILLRFGTDILTVEVKDDGKGFDIDEVFDVQSEKNPIGLLGMRESLEEIGGTWYIQSRPDQGTSLTITVPLEDPQ
jgi:PAS domain S-box-containing protein